MMRKKKYVDQYSMELAKAVRGWEELNTTVFTAAAAKAARDTIPIHATMLKALEQSMQSFKDTQTQIGSIAVSAAFASPSLANVIREASISASLVLASMRPYNSLVEQLIKDQPRWAQSLKDSITGPYLIAGIEGLVTGNFSLVAECALRTQLSLARIDATRLARLVASSGGVFESFQHALTDAAKSYRNFWNALRVNQELFLSFPTTATQCPTTEMYLAAHQAEVLTSDADVLPEDEKLLVKLQPLQPAFRDILASVDVDLLKLYEGAREAISSKNPDRVRHASISLRELITHIIHKLAPDHELLEWNRDASNLKDGRPTRKGRLLFICKGINNGPFTEFVHKDVSAALAFFDVFQNLTHVIESSCSEKQMDALLIRTEALLWYLIKVSQEK